MEHLSTKSKAPGELEKILFELPKSDWHPYLTEGLWAERLRTGRYRLRNIPFAIYGYSFGDVVRVEEVYGRRLAGDVIFRGGHSTYRLFLEPDTPWASPLVETLWSELEARGCRCEHATERLVAVDLPPHTEVQEVEWLFHQGTKQSIWRFEEAHRSPFHPVSLPFQQDSEVACAAKR